jgi:NTP pyrophosphatase (non-canonical NTP hydrolase)
MNLLGYQSWTSNTADYPLAGTGAVNEIMYLGLGINGEIAEWVREEYEDNPQLALDEIGDCHWYATRLAKCVDLNLVTMDIAPILREIERTVSHPFEVEAMMISGKIANHVKKLYRDNNTLGLKEKIANELLRLFALLELVIKNHGMTVAEVLTANVEKLEKRKKQNKLHGSGER